MKLAISSSLDQSSFENIITTPRQRQRLSPAMVGSLLETEPSLTVLADLAWPVGRKKPSSSMALSISRTSLKLLSRMLVLPVSRLHILQSFRIGLRVRKLKYSV